jgi:hypothetical protein
MRVVALAIVVVGGACGRAAPDPPPFVDEIGAETAAKAVCFDEEGELTTALDDDYLAAETVLLQEADVDRIARAAAFDTEQELLDVLGDNFLDAETAILNDADIDAAAREACFDSVGELTAVLDDEYLPIDFSPDFSDIANVPAGFLDGVDNDTAPTGVAPILVNGARAISLDTTGCANGESYVFSNGSFQCVLPGQPRSLQAANATQQIGQLDVLPVVIKAEVSLNLAQGVAQNHAVFNATTRAQRNLLIIDAWAVGTGTSTNTTWNLRDGATDITSAIPAPTVAGGIERATEFVNAAARQINTNDDLNVRAVTQLAGGEAVTFTVFILAIPI